ncbi:DAR GTPase 3, chloroplastic [Brassica rapa]|uniref:DAR GTPase 3, chloroplastic n=1 Tax=Brassica campestris TaxID=3711 RepID=UPI00142DFBE4|nr:DAR GTPase 3, chloroplastic [Brassica rapa]
MRCLKGIRGFSFVLLLICNVLSAMLAQLSPSPSPSPANLTHFVHRRTFRNSTLAVAASPPTANSSRPPIQIVGGKDSTLDVTRKNNSKGFTLEANEEEIDWMNLESDIRLWTRALRPVQWYPGHIMKTEKELREQLKLMDVVIEVRDARIPLSTTHPKMDAWLGNRKRILVLNREDMISTEDRNDWARYFAKQGIKVIFTNGKLGMGAMKLGRLAKSLAGDVNGKRREKGLLPRPVRAGIIGYPNVGKSSLINRLLKRKICAAAPRPGVTREMKWVKLGDGLDLLDSPGMLPMRIDDQAAAIKLAICDDIGEKAYDFIDVAGILVQMLARIPEVGSRALYSRYKIQLDGGCGKKFVKTLGLDLFGGDSHQAAFRILSDFRKGKFGYISLERPPL